MVSESYKAFVHNGDQPRLFHYRESRGAEIDLVVEKADELSAVRIKSGATISRDFFKNLGIFSGRIGETGGMRRIRSFVVYGGGDSQRRSQAEALSWRQVRRVAE